MEPILITVIGAGASIVGVLIGYFSTRRLNQASALKAITESTLQLLKPLQERITELEAKTDALEKEQVKDKGLLAQFKQALIRYAERVSYLMKGTHRNIEQIKGAGMKPMFVPNDWIPPEVDDD